VLGMALIHHQSPLMFDDRIVVVAAAAPRQSKGVLP
jgi:hypothetical protein